MEQLIGLSFGDANTDTTLFPAVINTSGTGLCGQGPFPCGSSDPAAPVTGYVDYLDVNGNPLALGGGGAAPDKKPQSTRCGHSTLHIAIS